MSGAVMTGGRVACFQACFYKPECTGDEPPPCKRDSPAEPAAVPPVGENDVLDRLRELDRLEGYRQGARDQHRDDVAFLRFVADRVPPQRSSGLRSATAALSTIDPRTAPDPK